MLTPRKERRVTWSGVVGSTRSVSVEAGGVASARSDVANDNVINIVFSDSGCQGMKREREKKMEHGAGVRRHDSLVTLAASLIEVGRYSQLFTGGGCHVQKIVERPQNMGAVLLPSRQPPALYSVYSPQAYFLVIRATNRHFAV